MAENNVLVAHFPRSAVGYSQGPVDEFVRQIGERLEEMQARVDELTIQNDRLAQQAATAVREQSSDGQRETALANAMLAVEQRRLTIDAEIEAIKQHAQKEADSLKETAKRDAEAIRASAKAEIETAKEALRRETEGLKETLRKEAESAKQAARQEGEQLRLEAEQLRAEAELIRGEAQAEATQIVGRAKLAAEEMMDEAVDATNAEEERLQTLCAQYDSTVAEVRRVLEMQLSMLPEPRGAELAGGVVDVVGAVSYEDADTSEEMDEAAYASEALAPAA